MDPAQIYADVAVSGAKGYNSRDQWHHLNQQLAQGDVLVVAAIDRLGRRYLETMWAIYDLQCRGIRLGPWPTTRSSGRSTWTPTPTRQRPSWATSSPAWAAYVASQERQNISRRTMAGLQAAKAKGVELGRPRRLTDEQVVAIR